MVDFKNQKEGKSQKRVWAPENHSHDMDEFTRGRLASAGATYQEFDGTLYITVPFKNLNLNNQRQPLYYDVQGKEPEGHPIEQTENVDMSNLELHPEQWEQEFQRAKALSQKPIGDAPPYYFNLPWDEMHDITIEEMIVYFPNHVLRWPGLALLLRKQGWDRLFQRTALLINMSRDRHLYHRDFRHAEPLPLMIKVQAAIQEFEPSYTLAEHDERWESQIGMQWLHDNIRRLPRAFHSKPSRVATLEETSSYIKNHIFQDFPFSRRMVQLSFQSQARKISNPLVTSAFVPEKLQSQPRTETHEQREQYPSRQRSLFGDVSMMNINEFGESDDGYIGNADTDTPPSEMECWWSARFKKLSCQFMHPNGINTDAQGPKCQNDGKQKPDRRCHDGADCRNRKCLFEHPDGRHIDSQQSNEPNDSKDKKPNRDCRSGVDCQNRKCPFEHPNGRKLDAESSPPPHEARDPGQSKYLAGLPCQYGAKCKYKERCKKWHPQDNNSPQNGQQKQQNHNRHPSQQKRNQQQSKEEPSKRLCKHNLTCKNLQCPFAHQSTAASPDTKINLDQPCKFGADCTNKKCDRSHPSPTRKGRNCTDKNGAPDGGHSSGQRYDGNRSKERDQHNHVRGGARPNAQPTPQSLAQDPVPNRTNWKLEDDELL